MASRDFTEPSERGHWYDKQAGSDRRSEESFGTPISPACSLSGDEWLRSALVGISDSAQCVRAPSGRCLTASGGDLCWWPQQAVQQRHGVTQARGFKAALVQEGLPLAQLCGVFAEQLGQCQGWLGGQGGLASG